MSWFDATGFASFAKSALNTAQKTIDKALDIKDESSPVPHSSQIPVPDVDTFFESFGLGNIESTADSKPIVKSRPITQESPSLNPSGGSSQNSGFWTDAWGSFFETKAAAPEPQKPLLTTETDITTLSPTKIAKVAEDRAAVSSQPQRARLFPGGVKPSNVEPSSQIESQGDSTNKDDSTKAMDISHCDKPIEDAGETKLDEKAASDASLAVTSQEISGADITASSQEQTSSDQCDIPEDRPAVLEEVLGSVIEFPDESLLTCNSKAEIEVTEPENKVTESEINVDESELNVDESEIKIEKEITDTPEIEVQILASAKDEYVEDDSIIVVKDQPQGVTESFEGSVIESPCSSISSSYVNLEYTASNPVLLETCSGDLLLQPEQITSKADDLRSTTPQSDASHESDPKGFSDSFHIMGDSVMQRDDGWVVEMADDSVTQSSSDDHQSRSGDTGSNSSKDDCEMYIKDCEIKSSGSSSRSQEMSSSFVKCSLEDLEYVGHRGQSPLSTTNSERSDLTKLESEQNTSGDENETTTSSDIEILSPPNGENTETNTYPLRHLWVPQSLSIGGSESPASDCSKESMTPAAGAAQAFPDKSRKSGSHKLEKSSKSKKFEGVDVDKLLQQRDELQALLEARERKVMELSTESIRLHDNEERLQNQVGELQLHIARESQTMSSATKDLTQRFVHVEQQAAKVTQERDVLKKQLEEAQQEVVQRVTLKQMEEAVKEKDQTIKELMDEGQKLSKKELQHMTIIKKLRAKDEETEHNVKTLKDRLEENSREVERLRRSIAAKDEQEKTHIDAIRQLTNTVAKDEKEILLLRSNFEDSIEKEQSSKKSLESLHKELIELRNSCSAKDKEIKELNLSVEMAAKQKLREGLDQASKEANREKEMLLIQMEDLRNSLKRCQEETNLRENALREDITRLQMRLQESETRNEELTRSISNSSRPLVRQMETLQASYNSQLATSEKIEKSLTDRLNDSQNQVSVSLAKEKLAKEKYQEISSKLVKLETHNNSLLQENVQLSAALEVANSKVTILEDSKNRNVISIDDLRHDMKVEMDKLKEDKEKIQKELENCIELLKEERSQNQHLQEELKIKENKLNSMENNSPCPSPTTSIRSSIESVNNWNLEESQVRRISAHLSNYRLSVYDSLTKTGCTTSILENLQSQLKQREGEIGQLQCEISKLEKERESVSQELVEITVQNEELAEKLEKLQHVEKLHKDLSQKYNALLEMYNEKREEYEALLLDLADVKKAYRRQIEELLQSK